MLLLLLVVEVVRVALLFCSYRLWATGDANPPTSGVSVVHDTIQRCTGGSLVSLFLVQQVEDSPLDEDVVTAMRDWLPDLCRAVVWTSV